MRNTCGVALWRNMCDAVAARRPMRAPTAQLDDSDVDIARKNGSSRKRSTDAAPTNALATIIPHEYRTGKACRNAPNATKQPNACTMVGAAVLTVGCAEDDGTQPATTHRRVCQHTFMCTANANTCPLAEGNALSATTMPKTSASASPKRLERWSMRTCASTDRAAAMVSRRCNRLGSAWFWDHRSERLSDKDKQRKKL